VSSAANSIAEHTVQWFAIQTAEVVAQVLRLVLVGWVYVPATNTELSTECTAGGGLFGGGPVPANCRGPIYFMQSHTYQLLALVALGAFMVGAIRIMIRRDGKDARAMVRAVGVLVGVLGLGIPIVGLATSAGHGYSTWIVDQAVVENCPEYQRTQDMLEARAQGTGPDAQDAQQQLDAQRDRNLTGPGADNPCTLSDDLLLKRLPDSSTGDGVGTAASFGSPLLLLTLDSFLIVALLAQVFLKAARGAALALVVAFWALMRALALGGDGSDRAARQSEAWIITLVLWEPVAATIDAFALRMVMQPDYMSLIYGLISFFVALIAMPTLHRLAAPITTVSLGDASGLFSRARGGGTLDLAARALGAPVLGAPRLARVARGAANVARAGRRAVIDGAQGARDHVPGGKP
jgi:hypothetical protein